MYVNLAFGFIANSQAATRGPPRSVYTNEEMARSHTTPTSAIYSVVSVWFSGTIWRSLMITLKYITPYYIVHNISGVVANAP